MAAPKSSNTIISTAPADSYLHPESTADDTSYDSSDGVSPSRHSVLRVMQWNIHGWRDTYHKDNFMSTLAAVRANAPDVLVLNEVLHPYALPAEPEYLQTVRSGKGNGWQPAEPVSDQESYLRRLAEETGLVHYEFGQAVEDGYFGRFGYGNAVLSRYPLKNAACSVLLASEFEYTEGRRIEAEDRCVLSCDVCVHPNGPGVSVCTTHLDQLDEGLRRQQMAAVLEHCPESCMLVGDFNTYQQSDYDQQGWDQIVELWTNKKWGPPPTHSPALEALADGGFEDAHYLCQENRGTMAAPTCWVIEPKFRIDYCMLSGPLSRQWNVDSCGRDAQACCSDHFPILVDISARLDE